MNLIKFNPIKQKNTLPGFFDEFFNRSLSDIVGSDFTTNTPSVNIIEEDEHFKIELAAPGLKKEDFDIEIKDGRLIISAKVEHKETVEEKGYFTRKEFNYNSFSRSFYLPDTVNEEGINAHYEKGVLQVLLIKKAEADAPSPKTIKIK